MTCYLDKGTVNFYEANTLLVDQLVVDDGKLAHYDVVISLFVCSLPLLAALCDKEVKQQMQNPLFRIRRDRWEIRDSNRIY